MKGTNEWTWVSALTTRYKLILSPTDKPWLVDMEKDPDEIKNFCFDADHRDVVEDIDTGGMKAVHVVYDNIMERFVAKAILKDDKLNLREKFIKEARLTSQLDHPNIVPVYELGLEGEKPFFIMKWLRGNTLDQILSKLKDVDKEFQKNYTRVRLLDVFQRVCEAMAFAHSKGIAHLDLKPSNIIISEFGESHVIDWGLARQFADFDYDADDSELDLVIAATSDNRNGCGFGLKDARKAQVENILPIFAGAKKNETADERR